MTYVYTVAATLEYHRKLGGARYANVWRVPNSTQLNAGTKHSTREDADKAVDNAKFETPRPKCLYRVVVRFK